MTQENPDGLDDFEDRAMAEWGEYWYSLTAAEQNEELRRMDQHASRPENTATPCPYCYGTGTQPPMPENTASPRSTNE